MHQRRNVFEHLAGNVLQVGLDAAREDFAETAAPGTSASKEVPRALAMAVIVASSRSERPCSTP